MKAAYFILTALLLTGCSDHYRYSCQDPANKDKLECNHPACDEEGYCYDKLNGLPERAAPAPHVEESPAVPTAEHSPAAPPAEHCNCENKGE